jgi:hypothetical protein
MAQTPEAIAKYFQLRADGWSQVKAAEKAGFSTSTAARLEKQSQASQTSNVQELKTIRANAKLGGPKKYAQLNADAKKALEDFGYFQRRYLGRVATPWQIEAANEIVKYLETPDKEYVVINCPPGAGKTTTFSHDIPVWLTCRNRAIRGMIGHSVAREVKKNLGRIKRTLENTIPFKADPDDIAKGLAVDAESTVALDYGRFRPTEKDVWNQESLLVMQPDDIGTTAEKEYTWQAYGIDSGFIGTRCDFVIWDDLVDPSKLRTSESKEKLEEFYDDVCETRLEPGGLLVLMGQRLSADDLYRYNLNKTLPFDEEEEEELTETLSEMELDAMRHRKKYHHIKFRAHYEDRCKPEFHRKDAPYYPEGCLLDPRRLDWKTLSGRIANGAEKFMVIYQQEDRDPGSQFVQKEWIYGGNSHIGCVDRNRDFWEIPVGINRHECIVVATADPSPTMWWAVELWIYHPPSEQRFLIAIDRRKMEAPDFLDWNYRESKFTGVMEDWQSRMTQMGWPIQAWVIEHNAAQRFLMQYDHFQRWRTKWGVKVIPHSTNTNKADPEYGVYTLGPHYEFGRVRIPYSNLAKTDAIKLIAEVENYPHGRTDDTVMAQWFLEWNLPNLKTLIHQVNLKPQKRPSWLVGAK